MLFPKLPIILYFNLCKPHRGNGINIFQLSFPKQQKIVQVNKFNAKHKNSITHKLIIVYVGGLLLWVFIFLYMFTLFPSIVPSHSYSLCNCQTSFISSLGILSIIYSSLTTEVIYFAIYIFCFFFHAQKHIVSPSSTKIYKEEINCIEIFAFQTQC